MQFQFMLAPMEDITGNALRTLCYMHGADLTFTEMARVNGLIRNNKPTLSKIEIKNNTPTQIQLAGLRENELIKFLSTYEPAQGWKGINFNLGCPSPDLIRQGLGCAMLKRVSKTKSLVKIVKDFSYPCSIKMRLGLNKFEKEKKSYLNMIKEVDADFFIVHARYGSQTYNDKADFTVYQECVEAGKEIIANGDIKEKSQIDFLKDIGVSGAMIGRAAVADPAIFNRLRGINSPSKEKLKQELLKLVNELHDHPKYRDIMGKGNLLKQAYG